MAEKEERSKGFIWWVEKLIIPIMLIIVSAIVGLITASLRQDDPPSPTSQETAAPMGDQSLPTPSIDVPGYSLNEERAIGNYVVRLWQKDEITDVVPNHIVSIYVAGQQSVEVARIENVMRMGPSSGNDITGEGNPDVIIERHWGGMQSTVVYDLGDSLTKVLEKPQSNCGGGEFRDFDFDDSYEFVTCDDYFAGKFCSNAASPSPKVILKYDPAERNYLPASPLYPNVYWQNIEAHKNVANEVLANETDPGNKKCAVLGVVLDYLYSGNSTEAWAEFDRLYTEPDKEEFRSKIEAELFQSPFFVRVNESGE